MAAPRSLSQNYHCAALRLDEKLLRTEVLPLVMQFVLLTYFAALAVALAAKQYQRPELYCSHAKGYWLTDAVI